MRKVSSQRISDIVPSLVKDDLPLLSLTAAVESEVRYLKTSPTASPSFVFGKERYTKEEYVKGLERILELSKGTPDPSAFYEAIVKEFDFYEVYGQDDWSQVFITSYFEPIIPGSLKKTSRFRTPLLKVPRDLLIVDLTLFDSTQADSDRKLRGRLQKSLLVPYFTRDDIDSKNALKGQNLEICWVDPVDAFFLQIQGSGTVDVGHGRRLHINYADQNGHKYEPIGKYLKYVIPTEKMSMGSIEAYLKKLPQDQAQSLMSKNPSYVFFQTSNQHALTYLGVPATPGRTIATDKRFFPKGALALLNFEKPVFDSPESTLPSSFQPASRLVLDQDIGGAIRGGGRVDLFWGQGDESKRFAGVLKNPGSLYYIAPKR